MFNEIQIQLTLNGETRQVTASVWNEGRQIAVYGVNMTTTHGAVTHRGRIDLRPRDDGHYTERDIIGYGYHGMRGNGHAPRSRLRYVGHIGSQTEQGA